MPAIIRNHISFALKADGDALLRPDELTTAEAAEMVRGRGFELQAQASQARGASSGGTAIYGVSSGWLHDAVNATATRLGAYRQRTETTPESALQTLSRNRMRKLCSVNGGNRR
jgi:hypothetical protein